ncbi:hypothetical protein pEaSNUABM3_00312 [Erwinia phage pEa_SNUABM_3]|uniref:Uncharacterized protein n=1 Tax=Erwinia phage pEa_SNUABM_3 TaxID=2869552 RepID=A0AAE7XK42_9CAUD|nr:hypothetical protein MPK68_gp312 [Erwinia phage pEa_SNUABM_3]QZE56509.1 hypothetical protein pEaSNUABM3_00312 [Erwinia phage pEa_SNUABM_3]
MSFDMRKNVLMVRSMSHGQPFYNFYNAVGIEFTLAGYQLKEIYDCHYQGKLSGIRTYWGFSNKATSETFEFSSRGDLMWNVSLNNTCHTLLPFEMIIGHEGFNVVNGFMIEDHVRKLIRIHQRAVGRTLESYVWFEKMTEPQMREMLAALGLGPLRIERADRAELIKIHTEWLRKHDDEFKYTHDAIGLDHDQKIPADFYDDHGRRISRRMLAAHKTVEMMATELSNLIRIFDLNPNFNHKDPMWEFGLATIAERFIYAEDAKEALAAILENSQFVVNGVYALARDYDWRQVNEETEEYRQSLIRRLLQELRNEIEAEDSMFVVEDGIVMIKAVAVTAHNEQLLAEPDLEEDEEEDEEEVDEVEDTSEEQRAVLKALTALPDDSLRKLCTNHKLAPKHRIRKLTRTEMIELCCDSFGTELPDDMDDVDPEAEAEVEAKAESGKRPRKYPALVDDVNISYDTIRSILIRAKIPGTDHKGELHRGTKEARAIARKKILNSLKTAVDTGLLETLAAFTLEALACALTKMKDGDRYPRDSAYLKELIKHATR